MQVFKDLSRGQCCCHPPTPWDQPREASEGGGWKGKGAQQLSAHPYLAVSGGASGRGRHQTHSWPRPSSRFKAPVTPTPPAGRIPPSAGLGRALLVKRDEPTQLTCHLVRAPGWWPPGEAGPGWPHNWTRKPQIPNPCTKDIFLNLGRQALAVCTNGRMIICKNQP